MYNEMWNISFSRATSTKATSEHRTQCRHDSLICEQVYQIIRLYPMISIMFQLKTKCIIELTRVLFQKLLLQFRVIEV